MEAITQIDAGFIEQNTDFAALTAALRQGFATNPWIVPERHHHDFPNPKAADADITLLLMPAWHPGQSAGIKVVTISPDNGRSNLPAVQGSYLYLDALTGVVKAIIEAKSLTTKRTAATSALVSTYLSREDATSMLMIGTGALSTNLIQAHAAIRPIEQVYVWGRNLHKAQAVCDSLENTGFAVQAVEKIAQVISQVDIISCATLSSVPLVLGRHLSPGQHIDLVGAYRPDMREADDETIRRASVYVDTLPGGLNESGDIAIPLQEGLISKNDIQGDLFGLCSGEKPGRKHPDEITLFKSVGYAGEDLVAADYYYEKYMNGRAHE